MADAVEKKFWLSDPPEECDICEGEIEDVFIDGKMSGSGGMWCIMCPDCASLHNVSLGLGKGQRFARQPDGKWLKVEG